MPARLVIPDVHEKLTLANRILHVFAKEVLPITWLGDFFDDWTDDSDRTAEMAHALNTLLRRGDDVVIGNHDIHYMVDNPYMRCSGFSTERKRIIRSIVDIELWKKHARVFYYREGFWLSHAGFHPSLIPRGLTPDETYNYLDGECTDAFAETAAGKFDSLFSAGRSRGGSATFGGPLWLDWTEFVDIPSMPQIVGHTIGKEVRQKGNSYCIDTNLNHVAIIDDGHVEIVQCLKT